MTEAPAIFRARWVLPIAGPPIEGGAMAVSDGRITGVGTFSEVAQAAPAGSRVQDFGDAALLPGLVNAHSHLELTALRGMLGDLPFPEWIRRLTRLKYDVLTRDELLLATRWGLREGASGGITCWGDTTDSGVVVAAMVSEGARGVAYQEVFGPDAAACAESLSGLQRKVTVLRAEAVASGRVAIGISPHALYTVSPELFRACAAYASAEELPVAVHAAESADEDSFVRTGTGTYAQSLATRGITWNAKGVSPIAYLAETGILGSRTLLIHAVRATAEDVRTIRASGSSVAHCPQSNAKLGHGVAPLAAFRSAGIAVGLGTDGAVSNDALDLFSEMKFCALVHRASSARFSEPSPREVLEMATVGGARALGFSDRIGTLEAGKEADFAVVDLSSARNAPGNDPESALVFSACARDVAAAFVSGRRLRSDVTDLRPAFEALGRKLVHAAREEAIA